MSRRSIIAIALLAVLGMAGWYSALHLPNRWKPWTPPRFDEAPNLLTNFKLRQLTGEPGACLSLLAQSNLYYAPVPDRDFGKGCEFSNAVRLDDAAIGYSYAFTGSCTLAAALALYQHHVVAPAAQAIFDQPVIRIEHFGSYACRNVNNRETGRRSQHARANALDVAGFVLRDGTRIRVRTHWSDNEEPDDAKGRFLKRVHEGACGLFNTVLGPDYNAAHADHFHFDMGMAWICR